MTSILWCLERYEKLNLLRSQWWKLLYNENYLGFFSEIQNIEIICTSRIYFLTLFAWNLKLYHVLKFSVKNMKISMFWDFEMPSTKNKMVEFYFFAHNIHLSFTYQILQFTQKGYCRIFTICFKVQKNVVSYIIL